MNRPGDATTDLIFGLIALHNDLVAPAVIPAALRARDREPGRTLADHLVAQGSLTATQRDLVETLSAESIRRHGGDAEKSLAFLIEAPSARERLDRLGDPELTEALDPAATIGSTIPGDEVFDRDRTTASSPEGPRFRILRRHARGGIGEVFVALDAELNREVALKRMQDRHADDPVSRARFLVEAEITGGLEHPGIVPVYGLGTYDGGRPYYAMRFIKGDSLKEAIDRFHATGVEGSRVVGSESLTVPASEAIPDLGQADASTGLQNRELELRRLLRRFLDVCNAIEYAHSRGVLHRDIKPGNIIVGKYGETLVVDWGLAKPAGQVEPGGRGGEHLFVLSSSSGSAETLPGSALGTPAYMSPEQARGELDRLGPRSDVYSLGATLYCLLTGRPPFAGDVADVIEAVKRGGFRPPRQLDASIDPALEAICLRAMAYLPDDRYPSCRALADDLDRWMADEPVAAWREPAARRARRWARRNRTAVAAAAVALVAGVFGLSAVLAVQTRANADLTRSQAAVEARYDLAVEAIRTFHTGVSEDFLLKQDQFKDVRDRLLKSASDFYGKLGTLLGKESDRESRRALWRANYEVAELTGKVGKPEDALAAHRQALAGREALAAQMPADPEIQADEGRSLAAIAGLLELTGRTAEAEVTYRKAETRLVEPAPAIEEAAEARAVLADCRRRLGNLLRSTGRNDEALSVFRLARADQESLAAAPGAMAESRRDLAATMIGFGDLLSQTGRSSEAAAEYRAALAIQQKLAVDNPAAAEFRHTLAATRRNLGVLLSNTGRSSEAEAEYREALAIQQKLADDNPAVTEFRRSLAATRHNLGWLLHQTGKAEEAEAEYREALAIQQKLADDNPRVTEFHSRLALGHNNLGWLLSNTGQLSEAASEYRKALAILQKLADDNSPVTEFRHSLGLSILGFGSVLSHMAKPAEAEAEFRKGLAVYQKLADDNPAVTEYRRFLAYSHNYLGNLLCDMGKPSEGEAEYRRGLSVRQKLADDNPAIPQFQRDLALSLLNLGWQLAQAGRADDAIAYYAREQAIRQKLAEGGSATPDDTDHLANCWTNTADVLRRSGRLDEALASCERALKLREPLVEAHPEFPQYRGRLAETYLRLGQVRCDQQDLAGAAAAWKRACARFDATRSGNPDETFLRACCHAGLAGLAGRPGSGASAAEGPEQSEKAMDVLRQAVAAGYRNPDAYRTESALDPLRHRDDFRMLMMDLAFPAEPFAQ